ncbi:MAG TPA: hypothetical protein VE988_06515 [Gemmataceae bacterium]|nr:hypothetical protein [Gemmataceae bacterium]
MADNLAENEVALSLDDLTMKLRHLSPVGAQMMAEAAIVCLENQKHEKGIRLTVYGDITAKCSLHWSDSANVGQTSFWNDLDEATEYGATAVAVLLVGALRGYTVVERSRKGTGFDWWLGSDDELFQAKARLEVSGILNGTIKRINARVKARLAQAARSIESALPLYVVVVEFGSPRARVSKP